MSLYSSVKPLSQRPDDRYNPNDTIDFQISYAGLEIDPQSIRISGELYVEVTPNNLVDGSQDIHLDPKVGAHALFQQYITSLPDAGLTIENFQHVPRYIKMKEASSQSKISTGSTLSHVVELKTSTEQQSNVLLGVSAGKGFASFSIKPMCALTNAIGPISSSKTGTIKLTCLMSSVSQLLYGGDVTNLVNYYVKNLQLDYMSTSDTKQPLQMAKVSSLKQTLTSSNQQLSIIMPITSSSLTMSFIELANENTLTNNYTSLDVVPNVSRVEFSFNDIVSNAFISYALENTPEILYNALMSMNSSGKFDLTQTIVDSEKQFVDNYLVGSLFGNTALKQNTKVGVGIQSDIQGATAFAVYMYFVGMMEL